MPITQARFLDVLDAAELLHKTQSQIIQDVQSYRGAIDRLAYAREIQDTSELVAASGSLLSLLSGIQQTIADTQQKHLELIGTLLHEAKHFRKARDENNRARERQAENRHWTVKGPRTTRRMMREMYGKPQPQEVPAGESLDERSGNSVKVDDTGPQRETPTNYAPAWKPDWAAAAKNVENAKTQEERDKKEAELANRAAIKARIAALAAEAERAAGPLAPASEGALADPITDQAQADNKPELNHPGYDPSVLRTSVPPLAELNQTPTPKDKPLF